jgi:hypothetical protein
VANELAAARVVVAASSACDDPQAANTVMQIKQMIQWHALLVFIFTAPFI